MGQNGGKESIILEKKLLALEQFRHTTRDIIRDIRESQGKNIDTFLQRRDEIIRLINLLDRAASRERQFPADDTGGSDGCEIELRMRIREVLKQAQRENEECMEMMKTFMVNLKVDIASLLDQERGIRRYSANNTPVPRFVSIRS